MDHQRLHWLEKFQVQIAAAVGLAVVYFAVWPTFRPWDPELPLTFLPEGDYGSMVLFAVVVWVLSGAAAAITVTGRPEGALFVTLVGTAGLSLNSSRIRSLLMLREDDLSGLFASLAMEVVLLAVVIMVAAIIIGVVRSAIFAVRPGWLWKDPLADLGEEKRRKAGDAGVDKAIWIGNPVAASPMNVLRRLFRRPGAEGGRTGAEKGARSDMLLRSASCLALGIVVAALLLLLLMRSPRRGQILFALFVSFFLAGLLAHQMRPTPYGVLALVMPVVLGLAFYALAGTTAMSGEPLAWTRVQNYARALPIDWATAGAGGAVMGFWVSMRIHTAKHLHEKEE